MNEHCFSISCLYVFADVNILKDKGKIVQRQFFSDEFFSPSLPTDCDFCFMFIYWQNADLTVANFFFHQELQDKATLSFSYLQMASLESLARH